MEKQDPGEPPTVDRMRADISRGKTGEKVGFPDPAAAPLGTDDEAAGHPPTPYERSLEDRSRPEPKSPPQPSQRPVVLYFTFVGALAVAIITFAYFV